MPVKTNNTYGKIVVSDKTVERFISHVAMDCYGIVAFAPISAWSSIASFLKVGGEIKGVKVKTNGDRIYIKVSIIVKFGVSIKAVVEALKESVKYRVEKFTGMIVETMDVNVMGVEN